MIEKVDDFAEDFDAFNLFDLLVVEALVFNHDVLLSDS